MTQKHLNLVKLREHDDPFWELENSVSYCTAASLFPFVYQIRGFSTCRIPTGILSYKRRNNLRRKVAKLNNFQSVIFVMPLRAQVVLYLTTKWNMKPQSAKFKTREYDVHVQYVSRPGGQVCEELPLQGLPDSEEPSGQAHPQGYLCGMTPSPPRRCWVQRRVQFHFSWSKMKKLNQKNS